MVKYQTHHYREIYYQYIPHAREDGPMCAGLDFSVEIK